ncbi:carboxypeptidase regulatory-like domain-containing protein [bacterium]|nr:carboxypeptidase regulatory-like domain-containing protein [bacterium]
MSKKHNTDKSRLSVLPVGWVIAILLAMLLLATFIAGCNQSEGRNIGGTIWGNTRSANNPDRGIGNAMLSVDNTNIFAITKNDGYFSITGIPEGDYGLTITKCGFEVFSGSTSVIRDLAGIDQSQGMQARVANVVTLFEFPSGIIGTENLAGTLVNTDGEPIENAEVDLIFRQDGYFHVTETDHAGSFYFNDLMPNPDLLIIEEDGYKPVIFSYDEIMVAMSHGINGALVNVIPMAKDEPEESADIGTVSGTVLDSTGNVLSGIKVAIYPDDTEANPIRKNARITESDETGGFEFKDIETGDYIVWAGHPNYFPEEVSVTVEKDVDKTIVISVEDATETKVHPYFKGMFNP